MSDKAQPNSIQPLRDAKEYLAAAWASDIDLTAVAQSPEGHAARLIRVEAVGASPQLDIVLEGNPGVTRSFTLVGAGWELVGEIRTIKSTTANITGVTVGW